MKTKPTRIHKPRALQLRVELLGVDPPIWRRLHVPNSYSFWDLHVAIQDAMGWTDSHLHSFRFLGSEQTLGIPVEEELGDMEIEPDWEVDVLELLSPHSPLALYEYDFGDSWLHEVRFEDLVPADPSARYPRCIAGARRCPPEDCGGPHGYAGFLRSIADPSDPEHQSWLTWCGGSFDPEQFDPAQVTFEDPGVRWKTAFEETEG